MAQKGSDVDMLRELSGHNGNDPARSLLDLIELKVFDLELAAWFVAQVSRGASYIAGSGPGGIGKTTTMRSLLSFVPDQLKFVKALPGKVAEVNGSACCVVSDELSDHPPPTYLWEQDLRDFFALSEKGHLLVGNMHADELDEVHEQVVKTNQVPESQFRALNLFVFICLEGGNPSGGRVKDTTTRRVINRIYYSDGTSAHELVYTLEGGLLSNAPRDLVYEGRCRTFLEEKLKREERTLEEVRKGFLEWQRKSR
ncbi:MAG: hypothetical protein O2954_02495 [bacterium]|nr:hypothetical protein [bacterium]